MSPCYLEDEDHKFLFEELLDIDNSVLAIELYNVFRGISPNILKAVFPLNTPSKYNIRNRSTFYSRHVNLVYNGTESLFHSASFKNIVTCSWQCHKIMETSKISLRNLENLHSANWFRVVDVILYIGFYHLLCSIFCWGFSDGGQFLEISGQFTDNLSKLFPCGGHLNGKLKLRSGEISVFRKVIVRIL